MHHVCEISKQSKRGQQILPGLELQIVRSHWCWVLNSGSLEEMPGLLATKPSLQTLVSANKESLEAQGKCLISQRNSNLDMKLLWSFVLFILPSLRTSILFYSFKIVHIIHCNYMISHKMLTIRVLIRIR